MRALVTGGAGFIGSHLCERLLADGHDVAIIDDLSTGSLANLAACDRDPRLDVRQGRVEDEALTSRLVGRADFVFHLAAAVGVGLVERSTAAAIRTNVLAIDAVLRAAVPRRVPVLVASSSEVYGRSDSVPFQESGDLVLGPPHAWRWSYGCSKALDEHLAMAVAAETVVPVVVARLFNIAGPRQVGDHGMVLPRFAAAALAGAPIEVHGDGTQTRCFCHVLDAVDALVRLAACENARGGVFNVGSDVEVRIRDLAHRVRERAGSVSPVVLVPCEEAHRPGFEEPARRVPDLRRVTAAIGWKPSRGLDRIIDEVLDDRRRAGRPRTPST
ncbi:MAG: NAD-dependent epimerase/dehydratase family protein [Deltaproteobacteria bacterium]|nr:NAD-dependent epimerase/dehydratase family protein [Deltaproteobacteria bacterium]